jgi:hypothetical protein
MSKSINEQDWISYKISEGYFGFDVLTLDKLYSEFSLNGLKEYFQECCRSMDDTNQTYINSRDGIPAFANWCKKEIAANDITINTVEYPDIKIEEFQNPNFDYIYQPDGRVIYDFVYLKHAFKYLNSIILNFNSEVKQLPGISDLALTVEGQDWFKNSERISTSKSEILERELNKIEKDVIDYLYKEDLDDYEQITRHLNVIPQYGFMGLHTDDTSGDDRDFTVIIYFNTSLEENEEKGTLRFHVPSFQDLVDTEVHTTEYSIGDFYAKMIMFDIAPLYTNVVVMNHTVNDNIAGLIRHEVDKNMSPDTRYSMYTTYRKK